MRVLGIETSSRRGTVALMDAGRRVVVLAHEQPNAHAEQMLPLVGRALAESGWAKGDIELIGVGVGPGSFTGVRVGIALAQGLALGLAVPIVGVTSLAAMAGAVPREIPGTRLALLDARRNELFVARFDAMGGAISAARAVHRDAFLSPIPGSEPVVCVGEVCAELGIQGVYRSPESDLPHAASVARLAALASPTDTPVEPLYVREADAVKPQDAPDALVRTLEDAHDAADPFP
jgi:tRNA threonylcarbamoyladenosine biosynthesis protein TsaB